uniref:Uncharacterized protein n=1 Tax=mine drainage metagenome TaxID=410659 RepID=E6QB97_9ZZZZ
MSDEQTAIPSGPLASKPSGKFTAPNSMVYTNALSVAVTSFDVTLNFGRNAVESHEDGTSTGYAIGLVGVTMTSAFAKVLLTQIAQAIQLQESLNANPANQ